MRRGAALTLAPNAVNGRLVAGSSCEARPRQRIARSAPREGRAVSCVLSRRAGGARQPEPCFVSRSAAVIGAGARSDWRSGRVWPPGGRVLPPWRPPPIRRPRCCALRVSMPCWTTGAALRPAARAALTQLFTGGRTRSRLDVWPATPRRGRLPATPMIGSGCPGDPRPLAGNSPRRGPLHVEVKELGTLPTAMDTGLGRTATVRSRPK